MGRPLRALLMTASFVPVLCLPRQTILLRAVTFWMITSLYAVTARRVTLVSAVNTVLQGTMVNLRFLGRDANRVSVMRTSTQMIPMHVTTLLATALPVSTTPMAMPVRGVPRDTLEMPLASKIVNDAPVMSVAPATVSTFQGCVSAFQMLLVRTVTVVLRIIGVLPPARGASHVSAALRPRVASVMSRRVNVNVKMGLLGRGVTAAAQDFGTTPSLAAKNVCAGKASELVWAVTH